MVRQGEWRTDGEEGKSKTINTLSIILIFSMSSSDLNKRLKIARFTENVSLGTAGLKGLNKCQPFMMAIDCSSLLLQPNRAGSCFITRQSLNWLLQLIDIVIGKKKLYFK